MYKHDNVFKKNLNLKFSKKKQCVMPRIKQNNARNVIQKTCENI